MATPPDRNLALELVRVTEAAAMAAGRWVGRGDKIAADQAAVDGMRTMLDVIHMQGTVVIGEGEKDEAPMLYNGEAVGSGEGPDVDVAVDPLEGTRLTANGAPNAIAVIAVADQGTMFFPGAAVYMDKIVVGPAAADVIDLDAPPAENVRRTAKAKGMRPEDVTVVVLDRDRHVDLIAELREVGAKVQLITDGDVAPSIAAARQGAGIDMLMGVGGTPEGVISAAAVRCLGGAMQGRLWPRNDEERQKLVDTGFDVDRKLTADDLIACDNVFVAATGVTDGSMLNGRALRRVGLHDAVGRHALTIGHGAADRLVPRAVEARASRSRQILSSYRLLELRRVVARPREAVHACPVEVRSLCRLGVRRVPSPRLERRRLERAAVGVRELPGVGSSRVHRVQVGRRVLVRLAAREEDDAGHGGRHVALEAEQCLLRHLVDARLRRALVPREHHVRLQQDPFEVHALVAQLRERRMERAGSDVERALDRVRPIHQHLWLDDGTRPASWLSAANRASAWAFVHTQYSLGISSPMVMTARHFVNRAPSSR